MSEQKTKLRSLAEMCKIFEDRFGLHNVGAIQRVEMVKAFYLGAYAVITQCEDIGEPDVPEDVGVNHLQKLRDECLEFVGLVAKPYENDPNRNSN